MCLWLATWDMKLQHAQLRGEGASTEGRGDGVLETEAEGAAGPRERLLCRVVSNLNHLYKSSTCSIVLAAGLCLTWLTPAFTHHSRRVVPVFIGDGSVWIYPIIDDLQGGQGDGLD